MSVTLAVFVNLLPLLMSNLRLTSAHLTKTVTNHLAFCSDCVCDVEVPDPSDCECQSEDYGDRKTFGTLTVEITGTMTPTDASSPFCSAPASCADVTGTYVIDCEDDRDQYWRVDQFVCASGGFDYYYANTLRIIYNLNSVSVRIGSSKVRLTAGDPNPYPSLTSWSGPQPIGSGAVLHEHLWTEVTGTREYWRFELIGNCTEECNEIATIAKCPTTSGALTLSSSYLSGSSSSADVCHPSSITVSASLTAAS